MFMTVEQKGQAIPQLMARIRVASEKKRQKISKQIESYLASGAKVYANEYNGGYGLLADAIYYDVPALAEYCLNNDIDLETNGAFGQSPLITSLQLLYARNTNAYAERLIDKGVDVTQKDKSGLTTLMLALKRGNVGLVQKLIDKGLSLLDVTDKGYSCLHAAIESGDIKCVDLVLASNPPLDTKYNGASYIFYVLELGNLQIFQAMLDKGMHIDPEACNDRGDRLLDYAYKKKWWGDGQKIFDIIHAHREKALGEIAEVKAREELAARTGWRLLNPDTVSHIDEQESIGYRITQIFNFRAGLYTCINHNMKTNAESSAILDFSQMSNRRTLEEAAEHLRRLGGDAAAPVPAKSIGKRQAG